MERLLKFLGFIGILAALYTVKHYADRREMEQATRDFVVQAVTTIITSWNMQDFMQYADTHLQSDKSIPPAFARCRALGKLDSAVSCTMTDYTSYKDASIKEDYMAASYRCEAEMEKSHLTILLAVSRLSDTLPWKIQYFNLQLPTGEPYP